MVRKLFSTLLMKRLTFFSGQDKTLAAFFQSRTEKIFFDCKYNNIQKQCGGRCQRRPPRSAL